MIKHIKILRRDLMDKKLYIYGTDKPGMYVFYDLACRLTDAAGFVSKDPAFSGLSIMNRPVLSIDEWKAGNRDSILLLDNHYKAFPFDGPEGSERCLRLRDAFEWDPELFGREIYISGSAGKAAGEFIKAFTGEGGSIKGYAALDEGTPEELPTGYSVVDIRDVPDDAAVVILENSWFSAYHYYDLAAKSGFMGDIYIKELISYVELWGTDPFSMIDTAIKKDKKVLLCCDNDPLRELIHGIFDIYGVNISREVSLVGDPDRGLGDIYELADEDPDSCVLFIGSFSEKIRYDMTEVANDLGFRSGKHNYSGLHKTCYNRERSYNAYVYEADRRFEYSIDYSAFGGLPGWAVYGNKDGASKRIMVLGGSTSSEVMYPDSWPKRLYGLIRESGKDAVIFNGSYEAQDVDDEFIRMARDIRSIKPDIVISFSGVNDMRGKPGKFEALKGESPFEHWIRAEGYMRVIAENEGARFYALLQPVNICKPDKTLEESLFFSAMMFGEEKAFFEEAGSCRDGSFINMADELFDCPGAYLDCCHYSEEGNDYIAHRIYDIIKDEL